jgi:hypothetical protein
LGEGEGYPLSNLCPLAPIHPIAIKPSLAVSGNMQEKRSKYQIRAQILALFQEGASKTKIVYQINLNFHTVETHLDSNNSKRKDWYEN